MRFARNTKLSSVGADNPHRAEQKQAFSGKGHKKLVNVGVFSERRTEERREKDVGFL